MTDKEFTTLCKKSVSDYFNAHADKTDKVHLYADDVYIVWQCMTLQNWKALVSTDIKWDIFTVKQS